jgi:hypothetical protein
MPLSQPVRDGIDVESMAGALRVAGCGMRFAERRDAPYGIGAS